MGSAALWGGVLGTGVALGGGLGTLLGVGPLAGGCTVLGSLIALVSLGGLRQRTIRLAEDAARGRAAAALLDAEDGPRLLGGPAEGRVLHANTQALGQWGEGEPLEHLRRRLHGDMMAADALERLEEAARQGLREEVDLPLKEEGLGAFSEPEWARVMVMPGPDHGTRMWFSRDVTARRAIDEVLLREREELADFLYFLPAGLYSVDSEGRLRYVNQVLAQWLGRTAEAMVGMDLGEMVDGHIPALDGAWEGRLRFLPLDDSPFDAEVRQATFDDAGQLRTRSVVTRLPEVPSRAGEGEGGWTRRRPWLFDGAPVGIALLDPEGSITDCNASFLTMVGADRSDVLDSPFCGLVAVSDRADLVRLVSRVGSGDLEGARADLRLTVAQGEETREVAVGVFLSPMTGAGPAARPGDPPDGVVAHLIDTTEQKNLEQQFAQAQKMQAMGQLAGGVAHDFNNLLTAMIGFSDLLLQRHGIGDPSFADIMQIKQNANRAANLVRQLLAFSRRQPLRPRLLSVTDGLSELSHLLRRLLGERVTLKMLHSQDPGHIKVDPGQFDQVIINLAVNARDAMPEGGTVTISTHRDIVDGTGRKGVNSVPSGDYVVIDVTDTGMGISRENLARLFEPFFTTKSEGTAGAGTGLGLSTVYGIVRQTEGYIFVDSALGEGATFTIYLPRHEPPLDGVASAGGGDALATEPTKEGGSKTEEDIRDLSGKETILLVEDEDAVRIFGARALRNKGYTVLEARSGEGAMEVLETGQAIDLLITDMVMPGMDGAKLSVKARENRPGLRIILISGYSEDVIKGDIVDQPDTHFLPKPFSLKALAEKVREVLN
jgi:two-component system cell cycle sensor histidine kinase/response regulator CckA